MTNGEKIQQDFACEVCEPIIEDDIIHVIFADKKDSAIGFDWSWWNAEYKEPTTKNNLSSETRKNSKKLENVSPIIDWNNCHTSEQLDSIATTKNDLGVDAVSRQFMRELGATCIATRDKNNKLIALGALDNLPSVTPQEPFKPMVEIDLDYVIKQKYIEREVLDKIRVETAELSHYYPMGHDYQIAITRCIAVIDKYKAEIEPQESEGT